MQGPFSIAARRFSKRAIIQSGLEVVSIAAKSGLWPSARGRGAIFTLHHVRPASPTGFDPSAHLSITPDFLDAAIIRLKAAGYVAVTLADLPQHLEKGNDAPPAMVFTLDDGYRDNAIHAQPVFNRHGVPFTVFVTGGFVDRTHSIWWKTAEELLKTVDRFRFDFGKGPVSLPARTNIEKYACFDRLQKAMACRDQDLPVALLDRLARGHGVSPLELVDRDVMPETELRRLVANPLASLGAHTISHPSLAHMRPERLEEEMSRSADRVEEIAGTRPDTFAYPYGSACAAGAREFEAASRLGFKVAVTTVPGVLRRSDLESPHCLPRISLNGYYQKSRYAGALASGIPFLGRRHLRDRGVLSASHPRYLRE